MNPTSKQDTVRFLYLRDPKDPRRVVTIARRVNLAEKTITFAYAINKPPVKNKYGDLISKGDYFNKKIGRNAAFARLAQNKSHTITFSNLRPIETIVKFLAQEAGEEFPMSIRRIAEHVWKSSQELKDPPCVSAATTEETPRFVDVFETPKNC